MKLNEALIRVYKNNQNREELISPFLLQSYLLDYCYGNFKDNEDVENYIKVLEKVNLFYYLFNYELKDALKEIQKSYSLVTFISLEKYQEYYRMTLKLKYSELEEDKLAIQYRENVWDNWFLYYEPGSDIYHRSYNCKHLKNAIDIYYHLSGKNEVLKICSCCMTKRPLKEHRRLSILQRVNSLINNVPLVDIPVKLNGKKLTKLRIKKYIYSEER